MTRTDRKLGARLRSLRGQHGYTQAQVAEVLDVHRPAIAEIEAGRRSVTLLEGFALAHLYGVSLDELVAGVGRAGRDPGQPAGRVRPLSPHWKALRHHHRTGKWPWV